MSWLRHVVVVLRYTGAETRHGYKTCVFVAPSGLGELGEADPRNVITLGLQLTAATSERPDAS